MIARLALTLSTTVATAALAAGSTYVVNAAGGPGVDFTDVPPAIAFAQSGDVLLVAPGPYSGFVLDKGVVVVGPGAQALGPIEVRNVNSPRAAIVGFHTSRVIVDSCAAPVVLQELTNVTTMSITDSNDVRVARINVLPTAADGAIALDIRSSRVEAVASTFTGHDGLQSGVPYGQGGEAGAGASLRAGARLVASSGAFNGGSGSDEYLATAYAGGGAAGIELFPPASVVLTGSASSASNGRNGWNLYYCCDCDHDGGSLPVITGWTPGGTVAWSQTSFSTVTIYYGWQCAPLTLPVFSGVTATNVAPDDPWLVAQGTPTPGAQLSFEIHGEVGAAATLVLGRVLVVAPTPGVEVERLVMPGRVFALGPIPGTGFVTRTFVLPPTAPRGYVFGAQGEIAGSNGLRRTSSTPIVVR